MTINGRIIIEGERVRVDTLPGITRRGRDRSVILFNAGNCVIGLGGPNVTMNNCYRGFVPGAQARADLMASEGLWAVVEEGYVGEIDLLGVDG